MLSLNFTLRPLILDFHDSISVYENSKLNHFLRIRIDEMKNKRKYILIFFKFRIDKFLINLKQI